jgi:hypothetical protein
MARYSFRSSRSRRRSHRRPIGRRYRSYKVSRGGIRL